MCLLIVPMRCEVSFQLDIRVFYPDSNRLLPVCRLLLAKANRMKFAREPPNDLLNLAEESHSRLPAPSTRDRTSLNDWPQVTQTPPRAARRPEISDFFQYLHFNLNCFVSSLANRNLGVIQDWKTLNPARSCLRWTKQTQSCMLQLLQISKELSHGPGQWHGYLS